MSDELQPIDETAPRWRLPTPGVCPELARLDGPHGWVQFKGTDICIDIHCECGTHGHIDGDFVYFVECGDCHRRYALNGNIRLHEIKPDEPEYHGRPTVRTEEFHIFREDD